MSHANARLTLHGRRLLVARVVDDHRPVAHVAKELGVSRQCAHRWVRRFRAEGVAGLSDRSSRPRRTPSKTSPEREAAVLAARATLRFGPARLSTETGVPARTISRILARHQVPPLRWLDPITGALIRATRATANRYEHDHHRSSFGARRTGVFRAGGSGDANACRTVSRPTRYFRANARIPSPSTRASLRI